ncbi:hypothetical protein [Cribrihabitans neustonicus]|uniref:hypothetical protein n=1 Tax=Cribrihabitans neustonicus TaxID=1429085 RepID=UPI003B5BE1A1
MNCKPHLAGLALALLPAAPSLAVDSPQRMFTRIDWPAAAEAAAAARAQDAATLDAFAAAGPDGLEETRLPVLILGAEAKASPPLFASQGTAYAAYYTLEGAQVSVLGAHSVVDAQGELEVHHETGAYESTGDGADYSLARFGAFYTLRITCDQPTKDPRCIEPAYLTTLAESLIAVKGPAE